MSTDCRCRRRPRHTDRVNALTAWTTPDGRTALASAGSARTVRRWDASTGTPLGEPLTGHAGPVAALSTWTTPDGHILLASAVPTASCGSSTRLPARYY